MKQRATKKPNIHTKVGRFFMAVQKGHTKKEAHAMAGYAPSGNTTAIEKTQEYQALEKKFNTSFLEKISMDEVAEALIDNIKQPNQTRIDRNARNGAIKIALDKLEPEGGKSDDSDAKVLIVLSK